MIMHYMGNLMPVVFGQFLLWRAHVLQLIVGYFWLKEVKVDAQSSSEVNGLEPIFVRCDGSCYQYL